MTEIVVLSGACAGSVFVLAEVPLVVGRSPESHVMIGDPWISSMHAMLERRGDEVWVVDLDSRNGTFVAEERVREALVPDGAVVRFGRTEVRVDQRRIAPEPPAADAPRAKPERQRDTQRSEAGGASAGSATLAGRLPLAREPEDDPYVLALRGATVLRLSLDAAGLDGLPGAPERLREALAAADAAVQEAGGVATRLAGVGVLAVFGLTGTAPDDVPRALSAARAARRAIQAAGGLDVRAAIETGPVLAGNTAPAPGLELAALGAAAERAERLAALAARGEILVGPGAAAAAGEAGLDRLGMRAVGAEDVEVFRAEDAAAS